MPSRSSHRMAGRPRCRSALSYRYCVIRQIVVKSSSNAAYWAGRSQSCSYIAGQSPTIGTSPLWPKKPNLSMPGSKRHCRSYLAQPFRHSAGKCPISSCLNHPSLLDQKSRGCRKTTLCPFLDPRDVAVHVFRSHDYAGPENATLLVVSGLPTTSKNEDLRVGCYIDIRHARATGTFWTRALHNSAPIAGIFPVIQVIVLLQHACAIRKNMHWSCRWMRRNCLYQPQDCEHRCCDSGRDPPVDVCMSAAAESSKAERGCPKDLICFMFHHV